MRRRTVFITAAALVVAAAAIVLFARSSTSASPQGGSGFSVFSLFGKPASGTSVGDVAPDFTLKTLDGQTVSLTSLRGRPVVLNFWASWCGPCKAELPALEKLHQTYKGQAAVIGVDLAVEETSPQDLASFVKSHGLTYPIWLDETGKVAVQYAVAQLPTTYVINKDGVITAILTQSTSYEGFASALKLAQ